MGHTPRMLQNVMNDLAVSIKGKIDYSKLFFAALMLHRFNKEPLLGYCFKTTDECISKNLSCNHDLIMLNTTFTNESHVSDMLMLSDIEVESIDIKQKDVSEIFKYGFSGECDLTNNRRLFIRGSSPEYKYNSIMVKIKLDKRID